MLHPLVIHATFIYLFIYLQKIPEIAMNVRAHTEQGAAAQTYFQVWLTEEKNPY